MKIKKWAIFLELIGLSIDDITDVVIHGEVINMKLCEKIKHKVLIIERNIVKEEINHITIIEIKEQLLQHQATVKEAIEAADIQLELIYDKHKNKKRGMKDYDEYIEVMELYIEYQDMTVKYLEVVSVNIDRIKHILSTHVTDSDVHNIEETPEIKIGDYVEIASRVMDDKILIPEFLKNGETK